MALAGPGRIQEPGASSGSPLWVQGPKNWDNPLLFSQERKQRVGWEVEQLALNLHS